MNDNYEKEIKKVKDKYDELSFELTKKNAEVQEQTELKEVNENKLKDNVKQMEELNELSKSKDIYKDGNYYIGYWKKDLKK